MFVDGLQEMQFGLVGLMMGAIFVAESWPRPWGRIFPIALAALSGLILWARKKINETYVFPRTGYVVFRRSESDQWKELWVCIAALIAFTGLLVASDRYFPGIWNVSGPLSSLAIAAGFVWVGRLLRFPHLKWLAGFSLLLGAATYAAGVKDSGPLWMMLGVGAALVVSGAIRFRIFLKTHPVMQEAQ